MARLAAGGWDTDALGEEHAGKDASIRGLMIGRMAVSDPWLVADIANEMAGGQVTNWANAPWESKRELLLYHLEELIAQEGEGHVLGVVRKYLLTYTRGLEGAKALREALSAAPDANALRNLLMQAA